MADVDRDGRSDHVGDCIGNVLGHRQLIALDEAFAHFLGIAMHMGKNVRGHTPGADFRHPHALAERIDT